MAAVVALGLAQGLQLPVVLLLVAAQFLALAAQVIYPRLGVVGRCAEPGDLLVELGQFVGVVPAGGGLPLAFLQLAELPFGLGQPVLRGAELAV